MSETAPSSIEQISDRDRTETPESVKHYLLGRIEQLTRTAIRGIESRKRDAAGVDWAQQPELVNTAVAGPT